MRFSVPKAFGTEGKLHCLEQILGKTHIESTQSRRISSRLIPVHVFCQSSDLIRPSRHSDRLRQTNPLACSSGVGSTNRFARMPVVARKNQYKVANQIFACVRAKIVFGMQNSARSQYAPGVATPASFPTTNSSSSRGKQSRTKFVTTRS